MINFIIPSVGRNTIKNTLESLIKQSNPNWECWVGFDGLSESEIDKNLLIDDHRFHYLFSNDKLGCFNFEGNAGLVRNWIISSITNNYDWIGFVDDDDTLTGDYVEKFQREISKNDFDCCVFRMRYDPDNDKVLPPLGYYILRISCVGISFCVKRKFLIDNDIKFINSDYEDYNFLEQICFKNGKIHISDYITYNVNGYQYS